MATIGTFSNSSRDSGAGSFDLTLTTTHQESPTDDAASLIADQHPLLTNQRPHLIDRRPQSTNQRPLTVDLASAYDVSERDGVFASADSIEGRDSIVDGSRPTFPAVDMANSRFLPNGGSNGFTHRI